MDGIHRPEALIELLQKKNHFLDRFFNLNSRELENFKAKNFEGLDSFYFNRERILDAIRIIDRLIEDLDIKVAEMSDDEKFAVREELKIKNEIVQYLLDQDLIIIGQIEMQKSEIIKELTGNSKAKKAISKFKAPGTMGGLNGRRKLSEIA